MDGADLIDFIKDSTVFPEFGRYNRKAGSNSRLFSVPAKLWQMTMAIMVDFSRQPFHRSLTHLPGLLENISRALASHHEDRPRIVHQGQPAALVL